MSTDPTAPLLGHSDSPPPLSIGSGTWPGIAKLTEESGELLQVLGKLAAYPSVLEPHPDGTDLIARLHDELGDVLAAIDFVIGANPEINAASVQRRAAVKLARFEGWHQEARDAA